MRSELVKASCGEPSWVPHYTLAGNQVIRSGKESLRLPPTVPDSPAPGAIATRTTAAESGERSENDRASHGRRVRSPVEAQHPSKHRDIVEHHGGPPERRFCSQHPGSHSTLAVLTQVESRPLKRSARPPEREARSRSEKLNITWPGHPFEEQGAVSRSFREERPSGDMNDDS